MKYFAKYLPVEGEIKVGDTYWDDKMKLEKVAGSIFTNDNVEVLGHKRYFKRKLFLCSRDIQIGDKVQFQLVMNKTPWKEVEVVDVDGLDLQLKDGEFIIHTTIDNTLTVLKVIGEISPEATWIKEGDEFEGHKIDLWFRANYIQVKGPCGHYH